MSDWNERNRKVIEEFRANDGKVGGNFENSTLLLLTTIGARSGKERVNPLMTTEDGDRLVIIASKGGAPAHPAWYHNLVANPEVGVEYGSEQFQARATIASEPERTELYEKMASKYPFFTEYQKNTDRVIPLVILSRV